MPWRAQPAQPLSRYSVAVLCNPQDPLSPSKPATIERLVKVGAQMNIEVEPIRRQDFVRLAEFDALLIRETTSSTTTPSASPATAERKACRDRRPELDHALHQQGLSGRAAGRRNGVPTPRTMILDRRHLKAIGSQLGYPIVLKIPDGSFSRGVSKVA